MECQAPLHKRKPPLLKSFWRRFWAGYSQVETIMTAFALCHGSHIFLLLLVSVGRKRSLVNPGIVNVYQQTTVRCEFKTNTKNIIKNETSSMIFL